MADPSTPEKQIIKKGIHPPPPPSRQHRFKQTSFSLFSDDFNRFIIPTDSTPQKEEVELSTEEEKKPSDEEEEEEEDLIRFATLQGTRKVAAYIAVAECQKCGQKAHKVHFAGRWCYKDSDLAQWTGITIHRTITIRGRQHVYLTFNQPEWILHEELIQLAGPEFFWPHPTRMTTAISQKRVAGMPKHGATSHNAKWSIQTIIF